MISVTPALRFAFHICTVYVDVSRKYQIFETLAYYLAVS